MKDWIIAENIITIAAIITAFTAITIAFMKSSKFLKRVVHFFDDYFGEEERPGQPARPGFSERLGKIESCLEKVDSKFKTVEFSVESIEKELKPNSGTSLRDAVNRIEKRVEKLESRRRADRVLEGIEEND